MNLISRFGLTSDGPSATKLRAWDNPVAEREIAILLKHQADIYGKARLLAAASKPSVDRLYAIPITSCLDDDVVRNAIVWAADICQPHSCCCGAHVDIIGAHALSCKRSSRRLIRHNQLKDIIHCSLNRDGIRAKRPHRLLLQYGKRPDSLTFIPWREGRRLRWDVTVANTTMASYQAATAIVAGSVAKSAAFRKEMKYVEISNLYYFFPIAIESHGSLSNKATSFLSDLGRCITIRASDAR